MKIHKTNKRFWLLAIIMNGVFLIAVICFFFGKTDFSAGNQETRIKIGACFMRMDGSYFDMLNNEISSVIEEHGDVLFTRDSGMDQKRQNEQINELIEKGVKAIFIVPVNWKEIKPSIERAKKEGIKIIVVDTQVYDNNLIDCTITSDNFDAGAQLANYLMTQADSANIVLLEQPDVKSSVDRMAGFKQIIKEHANYEIAAVKEYEGEAVSALSAIEDVIRSGTYFDTVFAINDAGAFGTFAAIEKTGYSERVNIMGVNGSPDGKDMIKKKQMMATAAQFPTDMGKKAAESMYALINHETCKKEIYIPVKLITKYTIESYDTDKWQ